MLLCNAAVYKRLRLWPQESGAACLDCMVAFPIRHAAPRAQCKPDQMKRSTERSTLHEECILSVQRCTEATLKLAAICTS